MNKRLWVRITKITIRSFTYSQCECLDNSAPITMIANTDGDGMGQEFSSTKA